DADKDLRDQWQDILDNLVVVDDLDALGFDDEAKRQYYYNEAAFIGIDIGQHIPRPGDAPKWLKKPFHSTANLPWEWMIHLRNRVFVPERDLPIVSEWVQQWRAPNGACRAMGTQGLGFIGHYGEAEGILQPIHEMMLQSWDGCLRIFAAWPSDQNGSFKTLRAQGAFLVSAAFADGTCGDVTLASEKGARCRVASPWGGGFTVVDSAGKAVATDDEDGIICFDTVAGETYTLSAK
ncbi:MAG: glycoside hydrolase family 95-like protein, partial [Planctomycetota bacterium]